MKKVIIGVVVLLAAALIGLKFMSQKVPSGQPSPAPGLSAEQQGVALPAGSAVNLTPEPSASYAPMQATGSYETLTLPSFALELKGVCEGGSPRDIMANHGKTWGYFTAQRNSFEPKKTQEMYNYVWDYYTCLAAARQDISVCSELPGEPPKDALKFGVPMKPKGDEPVAAAFTPMMQCREKNTVLLYMAYVAGKNKDQQNCVGYVNEWFSEDLARISPTEFCTVAAQGPGKTLAYLKEKLPDSASDVERAQGFSKSACGSKAECLVKYAMWEGLSTGNADKCPAGYKLSCAAIEQKSPAPCAGILSDMSRKYCSYYKELLKHGSGFAGVTAEEVKENLKRLAEKKKEEENLRKINEASVKQLNEKVRKMTGKTGE